MKQVIKGRTFEIRATAYSEWTGQAATSTPANLAGATIRGYFKERASDLDAAALFTVNGTAISAGDGTLRLPVTATQTRDLKQVKIFYEVVVKLSDGTTEISTGVEELELLPNVRKGTIS